MIWSTVQNVVNVFISIQQMSRSIFAFVDMSPLMNPTSVLPDGKSNSCQNSQLSKPEASFNPIGRQQRPGDWGGPGGPPFGRLVLIMQRLAFPQTCFDPSGFSLRSSPSAPNNNCFLVVSTIIKRYLLSHR